MIWPLTRQAQSYKSYSEKNHRLEAHSSQSRPAGVRAISEKLRKSDIYGMITESTELSKKQTTKVLSKDFFYPNDCYYHLGYKISHQYTNIL